MRGLLLKGSGWPEMAPDMWPIALFTAPIVAFAATVYRETLD